MGINPAFLAKINGTANDMLKFILEEFKQLKVFMFKEEAQVKIKEFELSFTKKCEARIAEAKKTERELYNKVLDSLKITMQINESKLKETIATLNREYGLLRSILTFAKLSIENLSFQMQEIRKQKVEDTEQAKLLNKLTEALTQYVEDNM